MTYWENKILEALIDHYYKSFCETEERKILRLRTSTLFPGFNTVHHDEKVSYLEAAESLERKGIVKLRWEKRSKGENLATISCENFKTLFETAGKPYPKTEAENIKAMLAAKITTLKETHPSCEKTEKLISVLAFLSSNFNSGEIGQKLNLQTMEEIIRLLEYSSNITKTENITIRALSILLYNDSKRLEYLLSLYSPLLSRAQKTLSFPLFNFPERSYPETMISGKVVFEFKNAKNPMVNAEGIILNLPLESAQAVSFIKPVTEKNTKTVLTIENKETFYALGGNPQKNSLSENLLIYDCFLYVGGYPNRAAAALIKVLAASGFNFHHAGDLDPDGVLIMQQIHDIADSVSPEIQITGLKMDTLTFDKYSSWARPLTKQMLCQIKKINEKTKSIPGISGLLQRIIETGKGIEQEIIDYR